MRTIVILQIVVLILIGVAYFPRDDGFREFRVSMLYLSVPIDQKQMTELFETYHDKRRVAEKFDSHVLTAAFLIQFIALALSVRRGNFIQKK